MRQTKVLRINTTAYSEEDFFLLTDLSEEEIVEIIEPIVQKERDGLEDYDNEILTSALESRYPGRIIKMYKDFETLTI